MTKYKKSYSERMNEGKRERGRERKKTIREKEEYNRRKQRGSVKYIKEEIQIYIIQVEEKRHIYTVKQKEMQRGNENKERRRYIYIIQVEEKRKRDMKI